MLGLGDKPSALKFCAAMDVMDLVRECEHTFGVDFDELLDFFPHLVQDLDILLDGMVSRPW